MNPGFPVDDALTLRVRLEVSGQLHGQDGVQEGGDESGIQAAHGAEHFEQQQAQRHAVLLHAQQRPSQTTTSRFLCRTTVHCGRFLVNTFSHHLVIRNQRQHVLTVVGLAHPLTHLWISVRLRRKRQQLLTNSHCGLIIIIIIIICFASCLIYSASDLICGSI